MTSKSGRPFASPNDPDPVSRCEGRVLVKMSEILATNLSGFYGKRMGQFWLTYSGILVDDSGIVKE